DEPGRRDPDGSGRIGVGEAGVAAGRDDDADLRIELATLLGRQDAVEGAPWLEGPGVLGQLDLEPPSHPQPVVPRLDELQWRTPDPAADASRGGLDVGALHAAM